MNDPSGSKWRKWDLHFHTPKSHDYGNKSLTAEEVVDRVVKAKVEVVAVTDHHVMDVEFIEAMSSAAGNQLTILPGVEFACPLGGNKGVHFIGIFAEDCNLRHIANEVMTKSGVNGQLAGHTDHKKIYVDFESNGQTHQRARGRSEYAR